MSFGPNIGPNTQFLSAEGKGLLSNDPILKTTAICSGEVTL